MQIRYLKFVLIGTILALQAGCASSLGEQRYDTFQQALSSCRHNQGGRVSRRATIPPTQPRVAECLKAHGWNSDGTRRSSEVES